MEGPFFSGGICSHICYPINATHQSALYYGLTARVDATGAKRPYRLIMDDDG